MTDQYGQPETLPPPPEPADPGHKPKPEKRIKIRVAFGIPLLMMIVVQLFLIPIDSMFITLTIAQFGAVILPAIFITRVYGLSARDIIGGYSVKPLPIIGLIVFELGLAISSEVLFTKGIQVLPEFLAREIELLIETQAMIMDVHGPAGIIWFILVVCFGAGIFEEVIFRGLILRASISKFPVHWAIFLNGVFFAIMHMSIVAAPYYILIGVVAAYAAYRTGTLMYSIIMHTLLNFIAFLMFKTFGTDFEIPGSPSTYIIGGIMLMIIGIAIFVSSTRGMKKEAGDRGEPQVEQGIS